MTSSDSWYPQKLGVSSQGSGAYDFMLTHIPRETAFHYAEFGIYEGSTAFYIAHLYPRATLHLFDFDDTLKRAAERFRILPNQVHYYGNTQKYCDSYNWPLMKLIEANSGNYLFDYCFLDGAHTIAVDALTFFLCDRLLRPGGFMDLDDYGWRQRGSSLDPARVPVTADLYTDEQIDAYQVKMLVDIIVKRDARYKEMLPNRIFRKLAA
jgi:hypothetical protein